MQVYLLHKLSPIRNAVTDEIRYERLGIYFLPTTKASTTLLQIDPTNTGIAPFKISSRFSFLILANSLSKRQKFSALIKTDMLANQDERLTV